MISSINTHEANKSRQETHVEMDACTPSANAGMRVYHVGLGGLRRGRVAAAHAFALPLPGSGSSAPVQDRRQCKSDRRVSLIPRDIVSLLSVSHTCKDKLVVMA